MVLAKEIAKLLDEKNIDGVCRSLAEVPCYLAVAKI